MTEARTYTPDEELIGRALATEGGHLAIGRGGFTLHYDRYARLSGYDCDEMKAACIARGLPVIDSRMVPFSAAYDLAVRGRLIAVGHAGDAAPWHSLSDAPLRVVAAAYRAVGADVVNVPEEPAIAGSGQ